MLQAILKRLRFRFSLRALLMGAVAIGAALGWIALQLRWIENRREILATYLVSQSRPVSPSSPGWPNYLGNRPPAPWPLSWFGEQGYGLVLVGNDTPVQQFNRIKELFPEATVSRVLVGNEELREQKSRD